jgi:hypothetical protein
MAKLTRNFRPSSDERYQYCTELKSYEVGQVEEKRLVEMSVRLIPVAAPPLSHPNGSIPRDYYRIGVLADGTVFADMEQEPVPDPSRPEARPKLRDHHYAKIQSPELAKAVRTAFDRYVDEKPLSDRSAEDIREFIAGKLEVLRLMGADKNTDPALSRR